MHMHINFLHANKSTCILIATIDMCDVTSGCPGPTTLSIAVNRENRHTSGLKGAGVHVVLYILLSIRTLGSLSVRTQCVV